MARPHSKTLLSPDELEEEKKRVAQLVEENQLAMAQEAAAGGRKYIRDLKELARTARDERAKFSALSKLIEIAMPKKDSPLVSINVGQNFVSHLGLPTPVGRTAIDVIPEIPQLPQPRGLLPEPEIMPMQIDVAEPVSVPKIGPTEVYRAPFSRKKVDMNKPHFPREIEQIDPKSLPEATPAQLSGVPKQAEQHPRAERYDSE